jgi:xanthine dehydrogenase accessory factor
MKELLDILQAYQQAAQPMALATIVKTTGATYRRPGARLLIISEDETIGCLSGGHLDNDIVQHGLEVIKTRQPIVISYDSSIDQDLIMGADADCHGVMEILIEYLPPHQASQAGSILNFLEILLQAGSTGAVATVIRTTGQIGLEVGDRMMVDDLNRLASNRAATPATDLLAKYARLALAHGGSQLIAYESTHGSAELFIEVCLPRPNLVVLGAGHDAEPLVRLAHELGFKVSVIDPRSAYANRTRFPLADEIIISRPEDDEQHLFFDERTVAVIMTHNYFVDRAWLGKLLPLELTYLGLMGPRKRAEKMLGELQEGGLQITAADLLPLHNPIGLDIGADTPEQIALAIMAEIQATLAGRDAGKLRQKKGPVTLAHTEIKTSAFAVKLLPQENACVASA